MATDGPHPGCPAFIHCNPSRRDCGCHTAAAVSLAPTSHFGAPSARRGLPPPAQPNLAARSLSRPQRHRRAPGPIQRSAPSATRMPTSGYRRSSCCFGSGGCCWSCQSRCALPVPARVCPYSPYIWYPVFCYWGFGDR